MTTALLIVSIIASALAGATIAVVATSAALRRSNKRKVAQLEHALDQYGEQYEELSEAIHRLTHVIAAGSQGWYWTDEWQEGEREADKDLAEGHFRRFTSLEELEAGLELASKRYVNR